MKKSMYLFLLLFTLTLFTNCREKETKVIVQKEESTEDKGLLERVGEKVDDKVNEEIDEEIDKIGDGSE